MNKDHDVEIVEINGKCEFRGSINKDTGEVQSIERTILSRDDEIKKLKEALRFYAEGWHYRIRENGDMTLETGEMARKALGLPDLQDEDGIVAKELIL
jgi:hypothetical protein